jgi:uncharacterized membrane protein YoaK (UPF0700 family)
LKPKFFAPTSSCVLTNLGKQIVLYARWLLDRSRNGFPAALRASPGEISFVRLLLCSGVWTAYIGGAAVSGGLSLWLGTYVLILPLCILTSSIFFELRYRQGE